MSDQEKKPKKQPSKLVKTLGAMLGGVIEACTLQPLDVEMFIHEGPRSFYKGLTPFVTHLVTKYSVSSIYYFSDLQVRWYFNEFYRGLLADKDGKVTPFRGLIAGTGSGITEAILIVTPFEVLKTRLQQQKGTDKSKLKYQGPVHAANLIVREEGIAALWKGNVPTMLRQGINQLFLFGVYDHLKMAVYGLERDAAISSHQALILGIIAGALGPLVNNPVDVAKTRLMAQMTAPGEKPKYTGTLQCISRVAQEEGFAALMRGCMMRVCRVAPGMGITFVVVEKFSESFTKE